MHVIMRDGEEEGGEGGGEGRWGRDTTNQNSWQCRSNCPFLLHHITCTRSKCESEGGDRDVRISMGEE